ncbi:LodA/GoxA family CTQ-dependent oxidase [Actinosynnema sp. CA-248983]
MTEDTVFAGRLRIYPSIGVARVGDSDEYYLPPAEVGGLPTGPDYRTEIPPGELRDGSGRLKRQAARFQVFYDHPDAPSELAVGAEVEGWTVTGIEWTAHLANKKAVWYEFRAAAGERGYSPDHPLRNPHVTDPEQRKALILNPGPVRLGTVAGEVVWQDLKVTAKKVYVNGRQFTLSSLGRVEAHPEGHLVVLGGKGLSGSEDPRGQMPGYANNDGWWDDVSDGSIRAVIRLRKGSEAREVQVPMASWVIVGPPSYAPQLTPLVSLYDTITDVFVRKLGYRKEIYDQNRWEPGYRPSFATDIWPMLHRVSRYPGVVAMPPKVHSFDKDKLGDPAKHRQLRQYYFEALRPPDKQNTFASPTTGYRTMPYMPGDDASGDSQHAAKFLTVTRTQYFQFRQWAEGNFLPGDGQVERHKGRRWTIAALSGCAGGAFGPGIEIGWICRNEAVYEDPTKEFFRFKALPLNPELHLERDLTKGLEPGDITMFLAAPWQADFNQCSTQPIDGGFVWWWPTERPLYAYARRDVPEEQDAEVARWGDSERWQHVPWVGSARDQTSDDYVGYEDGLSMVEHWAELGFIVRKPDHATWRDVPDYIEIRRTLSRPGFVTDYNPDDLVPPDSVPDPRRSEAAGADAVQSTPSR